jgi:hypothetical protein
MVDDHTERLVAMANMKIGDWWAAYEALIAANAKLVGENERLRVEKHDLIERLLHGGDPE